MGKLFFNSLGEVIKIYLVNSGLFFIENGVEVIKIVLLKFVNDFAGLSIINFVCYFFSDVMWLEVKKIVVVIEKIFIVE